MSDKELMIATLINTGLSNEEIVACILATPNMSKEKIVASVLAAPDEIASIRANAKKLLMVRSALEYYMAKTDPSTGHLLPASRTLRTIANRLNKRIQR